MRSIISDRETALIAVANDGLLIGKLIEELQHDREIVLTAVLNDGWASSELQNDFEVALTALVFFMNKKYKSCKFT